jgi:microcystin-dependent protein
MATSIWGLPQPVGSDLASTADDSIKALSDALDNATQNVTMLRKGTLGARPTAATAKSGGYYLATDTSVLYLSDGTNWITINDNVVPIGSIQGFGANADPSDARWVRCDGRAISRSTYAALFTLLSTTYGVGDGSTTFNIPDLRGRTLVAVDGAAARLAANDTLGASSGAETHTMTAAEMPAHRHRAQAVLTTGGGSNALDWFSTTATGVYLDSGTGGATIIENTGGGGAHNNMQPYLIAQYIMRIA